MRRLRHGIPVLALLACSPGGDAPPAPAPGAETRPLSVWVVNAPLAYFAERIGGTRVSVRFPAPPGIDPASWSPDAETIAGYQDADLILRSGAGYARWMDRASLPVAIQVDTSVGFSDRLIAAEAGVTHQHGPAGEHSHTGTAFTTWLDPTLAVEQARTIAEAFAAARPEQADAFRAGLGALEADLRALDARLARAAASIGDAPIVFSHPVYPYLERRYGLNGRSLHWEPDAAPDAAEWSALEVLLQEHPARILVWEAEPLPQTRRRLDALGIESVVYAPAGDAAPGVDWLGVMRSNAEGLEAAGGG